MAVDETIIIRRFHRLIYLEYELPISALNNPHVYGIDGRLYLWRATIVLDDEPVKFETESFYTHPIPRIWHESDEDEFFILAEPDIFKLLGNE